MSRIQPVNPESATGRAKDLLDGVQSKLGTTPNMMRAMAASPAVLDAYLQFSGALGRGELPAKTREQIALTVGEANSCHYCLAAHSAIGRMVGLTKDQIDKARRGRASDPKSNAALVFASKLVDTRGRVSDEDVTRAKQAGLSDGEIAEVVANAALNLFTNYFNHVSHVDVDFPAVEPLDSDALADSCSTEVACAAAP